MTHQLTHELFFGSFSQSKNREAPAPQATLSAAQPPIPSGAQWRTDDTPAHARVVLWFFLTEKGLAVGAEEEKGDGSGTGVGTDD